MIGEGFCTVAKTDELLTQMTDASQHSTRFVENISQKFVYTNV